MDTIDILRKFNIELEREHFNRAGDELMALCPFHEEKQPSFSLNVGRGVFYCFGCGESGNIYHLVEYVTGLSYDEIRKAIGEDEIPKYISKDLPKRELKTLSDAEIDALTLYAKISHRLLKGEYCVDPTDESVTVYTDYLKQRGISMSAAEYFLLGANRYSSLNLDRPRRHQVWFWEAIEQDHPQGEEIVEHLKSLNLINKRLSDYWFRPAILIPYQYQGEVYWINARHIPPYDDEIKYMGMKGVKRAHFFNEDALSEFEEVFCVEGELNAILMWDRGCKNVVSFGSKHSLTDELIERLWGKHIIYYEDTDKNDPEHRNRNQVLEKIQRVAKSVVYFEMKEGEDPASYLRDHSWHQFEDEIIPEFQYPDEPTEWQPHEIRPRLDKPIVISLNEAQEKNQKLFENLSANLPAYSGQTILCNMDVGTIKTTSAIDGINRAQVPTLVAIGQHNLANEYESRLEVPSFLHLYGRTHPAVGCEYHRLAMKLCNAGWSYYFKRNICVGKCKKAATCIHYNQQEKARVSHTLLVTHAHVQLFDFLTNPYYGNDARRFVIVDEMPELVREIAFTQKDIQDNIDILTTLKGRLSMGQSLFLESNECLDTYIAVFEQMNEAIGNKKDYSADDLRFHPRELKAVLKAVKPNVGQDPLPRFLLSEMAYAVNNGLKFEYAEKRDDVPILRYTWRPKFHSQATVVFLSATTTKEYLENQLGQEVNAVIGEQYYVQRKNLHVAQLVNLTGSRTRLMRAIDDEMESDKDYLENLKLFLKMVFKKHRNHRILIVTSLGCFEDGAIKDQIIEALQPIAKKANRRLVAVSARDLEKDIDFLKIDVPVIHYGMLGTNIFAEFHVCVELNAHYYNPNAIIEGIKAEYGIELNPKHFKKIQAVFKTLEQEYTISRWSYFDPEHPQHSEMVETFLDNNQRADMIQAEGRILRGEDLQRWIYRLHNVNITPYPNAVYKSWVTFLRQEFGYVNPKAVKGNVRKALNWIEENAQDREFTVVELTEALGGYRHLWIKSLNRLVDLGMIEQVTAGGGRGNPAT
ncbi:MAG: CHC2 zinc finger domain-containing protein [bacterium]